MLIFRFSVIAEGALFDPALWLHEKTSSFSKPRHTSWHNDWSIDFNSGQAVQSPAVFVSCELCSGGPGSVRQFAPV